MTVAAASSVSPSAAVTQERVMEPPQKQMLVILIEGDDRAQIRVPVEYVALDLGNAHYHYPAIRVSRDQAFTMTHGLLNLVSCTLPEPETK